jgi:hypothetical protein
MYCFILTIIYYLCVIYIICFTHTHTHTQPHIHTHQSSTQTHAPTRVIPSPPATGRGYVVGGKRRKLEQNKSIKLHLVEGHVVGGKRRKLLFQ